MNDPRHVAGADGGPRAARAGGTITAAVASQTGDAAAAMLVVSEQALKRYGLKPRARVHHMSVYSDDPIYMLTAPIRPRSRR